MIKRLEATNFCSFSKLEIDFEKQGLVFVGGDNRDTSSALNNGAGKSALFKALIWTLYGESVDGDRGNSVIRFGEAETRCRAFLEGNIEIERGRKKDLPFLSLSEGGVDFVGDKKEIQKRINTILGVNFDGFRNTVFFGQNDIRRFASNRTKDGERKKVLNHILGTEILPVCHRVVKDMMVSTLENLAELEAQGREIRARLDEQDIEQLKADHSEFEQHINEKLEKISILRAETLNAIKQKEREIKSVKTGDKNKIAFLKKIENRIKRNDEKKLEQVILQFWTDQEDLNSIEREKELKIQRLQIGIDEVKKKLSQLSGDRCFICNSKLKSKEVQEHKKKVVASFKAMGKEIIKVDEQLVLLQEERINIDSKIKPLSIELTKLRDFKVKAQKLRSEIKEDKEKAEIKREYIRKQIDSLKQQLEGYKFDFEEYNNRVNPYGERIEEAEEYISILEEKSKKNASIYRREKTKEKFLKFWVRGFSNRGILSFLLDSVVPFVESKANEYLKILSDGDIILDISTQRKLVTKDYRDEVKIDWTIEGIKGHSPSGGQLKKIEIAVGFALMKLVDSINGEKLNLLILDEVLDGLDLEGTQRVLMLLTELKREKESIFVISHQSQISEVFDQKIMVEKKNGVSVLL